MTNVSQLSYVVVGARDLAAWERFGADILGLEVAERSDQRLLLRMDENGYRICVEKNLREDLLALGWQVANEAELGEIEAQLTAAGVAVERAGEAEAARRKVVGLLRYRDPSGIESEVCYAPMVRYESPFHSPRSLQGFVTGEQGLGHCTLAVDDLAQSVSFYRDVLGLRLSDWIVNPHIGRIAFFHCNPRHHTLAFWQGRPPKRLHHIMMQLKSIDDVGLAYDLCLARQVPLLSTLGRHTNDHMVSFYLKTPSGFGIEYGWGARTVDDHTWQVQYHDGAGSIWGHAPISAPIVSAK